MSENKNDLIRETAEEHLYTFADYLKWNDGKRYELIDGQVYILAPAPSPEHQRISGELYRQISNYLLDKDCQVFAAPFDVRLPEGEERDEEILTIVQPDILVVCDKSKLDQRGLKGAPDMVIEIVSPSTAGRDRGVKRDLYERNGVREYWLVDYSNKTIEVYLLNKGNSYGKPVVYSAEEKVPVNIFEGLEIELSLVFRDK
ncbi:MAG: Uma2 family endonuclease [Halanaerobiales bacterium]